ncbi:unnamed protein product [Rhizoctonia solani]|uniref:Uncharacterized protein n=1 Tax=Rhizoctonia solani TaxID=456999 RepID=A0A8H3BYX6_9AGAM|nr:unnamed protein product [Rhizoctonia solani]
MPDEHSFDVRIAHTSPLFTALPITGNQETGWATACTASGYPCDGLGQSSVSTAKADATMSLGFWGSRIEVRGRLIGGMNLDWELDGSSRSPNGEQVSKEGSVVIGQPLDPEVLAVFEGLDSSKAHTLKFTTRPSLPSAIATFKGAVVTVGTGITGGSISMTYLDDDNSVLEYSQTPGGWARYNEYESPAFNITQPEGVTNRKFQSTKVLRESVSMNFNGTQVLIYGPCYSSNGAYTITLDQQEVVIHNASINAYSAPNAASVAGACLRYMSPPLSPDRLHYVNMANADQGRETNLDWVLVVGESGGQSISDGENKQKHNVSAIAGAVAGSVALLLALAALWWVLRYRRRRVRKVNVRASSRDSSDEYKAKAVDLLSSESNIPKLLDGERQTNVLTNPSHTSGNSTTFQRVEPFELPPIVDNARSPKALSVHSSSVSSTQLPQMASAPSDSTMSIPMVQMTTARSTEAHTVSPLQTPAPALISHMPIPVVQPATNPHRSEPSTPLPSAAGPSGAAQPQINQSQPSHANPGATPDLSQISSDVNRILAQLGQIRRKGQRGYSGGELQEEDDIPEGRPPDAITYTPFDELDDRFTNAHRFGRPLRPEVLLLRPNQKKLLLLCPLLPPSPTFADGSAKGRRLRLPAEAWQRVLAFAMQAEDDEASSRGPTDVGKVRYLLICKSFQTLATPMLYSSARIYTLHGLGLFANTLANADAKWDSIRRIPYSAPGRWVQSLSLAQLAPCSSLAVDSNLVRALPIMPFLTAIELDGRYVMSWRVAALIPRSLKVLRGIRVKEEIRFEGLKNSEDDALTALVCSLPSLEELSVEGPGMDIEGDEVFEDEGPESQSAQVPVDLPKLKKLTLLDCPHTAIYRMLTKASLPALRDLTLTTTPTLQITPPVPEPGVDHEPIVDHIAFTQPTPTSNFLSRHGSTVHRLSLVPSQQWPPSPAPAPEDLLLLCPEVRELTLCMPLPSRLLPPESTKPRGAAPMSPLFARLALSPEPNARPSTPPAPSTSPTPSYPLAALTVPVPTQAFLACLTSSSLRNLREVRFSSAKWLRKGMGRTAQGTGVNGEMMRWRRELKRGGIKVLDSEGKEEIEEPPVSARPMIGALSLGNRGGDAFKRNMKGGGGTRHAVIGRR